ncbi:MAG: carbohydrate ABC transporter permease, partial [Clostridia bacterium]
MKHQSSLIKRSMSERVFEVCNILFMLFLCFIMIYPLYYVVIASVSNPTKLVATSGLLMAPIEPNMNAYRLMSKNPMIFRGFINTFIVLVLGLTVNMILTALGAYFFSKKDVKLKKLFMKLIVLTMYFGGGLIPFYFTVQNLGLLDTYWALVLPSAVSTYNMIIMRTAFESLPDSLEESARIDGAGHW